MMFQNLPSPAKEQVLYIERTNKACKLFSET